MQAQFMQADGVVTNDHFSFLHGNAEKKQGAETSSSFFKAPVQPKLSINNPNDQYERQADHMADKIMRMEMPLRKKGNEDLSVTANTEVNALQRKCAECEEEEKLQRKEMNNSGGSSGNLLENYTGNLGGGLSLPGEVRDFYEPRFGHDFSDVKIYTDAAASESAQSINALAYTTGNNIVFNTGQYNPASTGGRQLLAHELTHVVQQQSMTGRSVMRQPKKEKPSSSIIDEIKKNPLFKKLPKSAQDKIIEELESVPEKIAQEVADRVIDSLNVDDNLKEGLKKAVEAIIDKLKGKPKKFDPCIPPFHSAGSSKFKGMCCSETIENEATCCPPQRVSAKDKRCCKTGEDLIDNACVKRSKTEPVPLPCPGNKPKTLDGQCCVPPKVSNLLTCIDPPGPQPTPPPPQPQPVIGKISNIGFNKDAPQSWYAPSASFSASVTSDGKANFTDLVSFLKQNPSLDIQIQGHASSEKPKSDPDYNQKLTDRRVKLIMVELQKKGIDNSRLKNIPNDASSTGCVELVVGVLSCGDVQAQTTVEASDRNVSVKAFEIK